MTQAGKTSTLTEVTKFTVGAPPASVFALPVACTAAAGPPPPTQREKDIAAETGSKVGDFVDAVMTNDAGFAEYVCGGGTGDDGGIDEADYQRVQAVGECDRRCEMGAGRYIARSECAGDCRSEWGLADARVRRRISISTRTLAMRAAAAG